MKKAILFLLVATLSASMYAQSFVATPEGLRDSSNPDNEFVVINFNGKSAEQLYDMTNKFCQKNYLSPKNSMQGDIKSEYLRVKTFTDKFLLLAKGLIGEKLYAQATYYVCFSFKDNKVKFEITDVSMKTWDGDLDIEYNWKGAYWCIYKKNGTPRNDLPKQYQEYFNAYIASYKSFVDSYQKSNDNW